MIENQNIQPQKMQVQIEELEKRVSTLSKKVKEGANTQELQNEITQLQTVTETLQTTIQTTSANITQIQTSLAGINLQELSAKVSQIANTLSNLQISSGTEKTISEVLPCIIDYQKFNCELRVTLEQNKTTETIPYLFICSPYQKIKVNFDFLIRNGYKNKYDLYVDILCNEEIIYSTTYQIYAGDANESGEFYFYSKKAINALSIRIDSTGGLTIRSAKFELSGNNVRFIEDAKNFNISCLDGKYYLCYNDIFNRYYDIQTQENLSLTLANSEGLGVMQYMNYAIYFQMVKEVDGLVQEDYCTRYITSRRNEIRNYYNNLGNSYPKTFDILTEYAIAEPNGFNCCATHSVVTSANELYVVNKMAKSITDNKVKLNGQECNTFVEAIPIAYRYQMLNTARKVFPHQITMHKDGFYYFSHFSALNNIDYQTKITIGGFARAYLQQDDTVNVYINKGDTIYKYVLAKDQDQKYQVSSATEFCKGLKYLEGMNGAGFLFDRDGNVSLVGVQEQSSEVVE